MEVGDPSTWDDLEARWAQIRPDVEALQFVDDSFDIVERTFRANIDGDRNAFEPDRLRTYPAGIRMLIATRLIEGQIDNGGWPAVFYNMAEVYLPDAIEGYRLLGLHDHAALAERALAHGWTPPSDDVPADPEWDRLDADWFALPDAEQARARFIESHPSQFLPKS